MRNPLTESENEMIRKLVITIILCISAKDCLEKAPQAISYTDGQMYVQAAQVYAIQELTQAIKDKG